MAQIKFRTSGGAWQVSKEIKTWDGSQWRRRTGYHWTGSTWDPIITYRHNICTEGVFSPYTVSIDGQGNYWAYPQPGFYEIHAQGDEDNQNPGMCRVHTVQSIDVTTYRTLNVDMRTYADFSSMETNFGVSTFAPGSSWLARRTVLGANSRQTYSLDVSSVTGLAHFVIQADSMSDWANIDVSMYNVWLS